MFCRSVASQRSVLGCLAAGECAARAQAQTGEIVSAVTAEWGVAVGPHRGKPCSDAGVRLPSVVLVQTLVVLAAASTSAQPNTVGASREYRTRNVMVVVMDGTPWSQTFGNPAHRYIPRLWKELRPQGTLFTRFYNNDVTITKAGHSTLMTGTWQKVRNAGPRSTMPQLWHYLADEAGLAPEKAWVVFGKGRYAYDATTSFPAYRDVFEPRSQIGMGERSLADDRKVFEKVLQVMASDRPRLIFANLGGTDHMAHSGSWERHLKALEHQDSLLADIWGRIQADTHYRDQTTLFLTNDHGFHLDGIREGFAEHGDNCEGCRHIMLLVLGPDVRKGAIVDKPAYQIDLAPTVGELLGFQTPLSKGTVLRDALERPLGLNRMEARTDRARAAVRAEARAAGNLLATVADGVLAANPTGPARSDLAGAILMWGMLNAYDGTADPRYLEAVRQWSERRVGETSPYTGLVLAELAFRLGGDARRRMLAECQRIADAILPDLAQGRPRLPSAELAVRVIQLAAAGEATRNRQLWQRAHDSLVAHLRSADLDAATAAALAVNVSGAEAEQDIFRKTGKLIPGAEPNAASADAPWLLMAVAFVRSHGLPFKGEYLVDVPELRAEAVVQAFRAVRDLPAAGETWASFLDSALNIAAIKELRRRKDVLAELEAVTEFDIVRLRPDSPEILPRLPEIRHQIEAMVTATNYNVEYGFPPYREFDYTIDLLRLRADEARTELEIGAFLLALDPKRRLSADPFVPSPRE